jgi:predicted SprT family Zn-dependent metalloprotease
MFNNELVEKQKIVTGWARELLNKHNLQDVDVRFKNVTTYCGLAHLKKRTMFLANGLILQNSKENIIDTILHEISHFLVGPGHGHDFVWKQCCRRIGARPVRCSKSFDTGGRFIADCDCGEVYYKSNLTAKLKRNIQNKISFWRCPKCKSKVFFKDSLGLLG